MAHVLADIPFNTPLEMQMRVSLQANTTGWYYPFNTPLEMRGWPGSLCLTAAIFQYSIGDALFGRYSIPQTVETFNTPLEMRTRHRHPALAQRNKRFQYSIGDAKTSGLLAQSGFAVFQYSIGDACRTVHPCGVICVVT